MIWMRVERVRKKSIQTNLTCMTLSFNAQASRRNIPMKKDDRLNRLKPSFTIITRSLEMII